MFLLIHQANLILNNDVEKEEHPEYDVLISYQVFLSYERSNHKITRNQANNGERVYPNSSSSITCSPMQPADPPSKELGSKLKPNRQNKVFSCQFLTTNTMFLQYCAIVNFLLVQMFQIKLVSFNASLLQLIHNLIILPALIG